MEKRLSAMVSWEYLRPGGDKRMSDELAARTVDLTNCDTDSHPWFDSAPWPTFGIRRSQLKIVQVSNNTFDFLGLYPLWIAGKQLEELLDIEQISFIQKCLAEDFESVNPLKVSINTQDKTLVLMVVIHDQIKVLELEHTASKKKC